MDLFRIISYCIQVHVYIVLPNHTETSQVNSTLNHTFKSQFPWRIWTILLINIGDNVTLITSWTVSPVADKYIRWPYCCHRFPVFTKQMSPLRDVINDNPMGYSPGGGGHCLFEGSYPLPNYHPRFFRAVCP